MALVIRFHTATFDIRAERPNPINPIAGESLLLWLRERAAPVLALSEPDAEDWGWYALCAWAGRQYLLGTSASDEEEGGKREWILQVDKHRTLKEKLLGREKMARDDPCARHVLSLLQHEPTFEGVSVDPAP